MKWNIGVGHSRNDYSWNIHWSAWEIAEFYNNLSVSHILLSLQAMIGASFRWWLWNTYGTQITRSSPFWWSLNQLWKSSYNVYTNFLKTETKFIMTSHGQHNDLANMQKILHITFHTITSYKVFKSNKDYIATSHRPPILSNWTHSISSYCPVLTEL